MLEVAVIVMALVFAVWFFALFRFHLALEKADPALSREIGKPSLFWTAFNGHSHLVNLMRRHDLADGRYAPLAGMATFLRVWAFLLLASMAWVSWAYWLTPGL